MKRIIWTWLFTGIVLSVSAQNGSGKAWEFGVGGTVYQFNRVSFSNFTRLPSGDYQFDLSLRHAVYAGNLYLARELSDHFALDLQANVGFTEKALGNSKRNWLYDGELGLQWRLGGYFNSPYIDPYLRAGIGYMHKDFTVFYTGTEGLDPDEMRWVMENINNAHGADRTTLMPVSVGGGVNMWLNDRFGIGLQASYLIMPYEHVANTLQGTARLMFRFGGKSKRPQPVVQYVDRPVERIVEKEVKKVVEVPVTSVEKILVGLFENIHFDFDKDVLTADSYETIDRIAEIIKQDTTGRYLITGFTDSRGSLAYNLDLSGRRARRVMDALVSRGVPASMLKARGVASKIAIASPSASDDVRRGDRKVTIELITNTPYWEYLGKKGL